MAEEETISWFAGVDWGAKIFVGPAEEATAAALLTKQNRNTTGCNAVQTTMFFTRFIFVPRVRPSFVQR